MPKSIEVVEKNVDDLKLDFGNPRTITEEEYENLKESLKTFDDFGSIVINEDDQVIAGNQRVTVMRELGWEKPVLCKKLRGYTKAELKAINLRANKNAGQFDGEQLLEWIEEIRLADIDVDVLGFNEIELEEYAAIELEEEPEEVYTRKIVSPQYTPSGEKPKLKDLVDKTKRDELVRQIQESDVPDREKEFLIAAAERHLTFNYGMIADYYAHSNKKIQALMEKSALVIIDFKNAIEDGYVQLAEELKRIQANDET